MQTRRFVLAVVLGIGVSTAHADMQAARQALSDSDYTQAVEQLEAVLAERPDDSEARFLKGLALARSGDTQAAISVFEELTEQRTDMAEAWNNLGVLRARRGSLTDARDALQRAIRIDPKHGPAQENLGDIYVALAREAYGRAGDLEEDNAIARAKREQLAAFIDNAGGSGIGAADTPGDADAGATPNAEGGDSADRAVVDADTPAAAVQRWADAWSAQDVAAYLGVYAEDFVPAEADSRAAWAAERRERVSSPARIEVSLGDTRIERRGDQALARFEQRYRSDTYQDVEAKALLLTETDDGWRILREGAPDAIEFTAAGDAMPSREDERTRASADAVAAEVRTALDNWAEAWSDQDVQGYLNAYSDNFEPAGDRSRAAWAEARRERVRSPDRIRVELDDIRVTRGADDTVRARFEQHYESEGYSDRERKQVTLEREDGGWRIIRES
ncbi:YybH family protein [Salinisphaera orenii]|uniref:Cds6 C-terminal domain-containing protein n=1 Tax=Salinisphaera orenii YIM 95161 TaxID=1051139 RepID=A0A423PSS9_9GAMM|nr:tetratricopeptide repeat protein [Salinisphaera halophila]ROO28657.1 hypothetical protein SAHL_09825 [Salinisphaera halophila YIM 95161]